MGVWRSATFLEEKGNHGFKKRKCQLNVYIKFKRLAYQLHFDFI